jgi:predicted transcriptional regulator of viral defense system
MNSLEFIRTIQRRRIPVFTTAYSAGVIRKEEKYTSLFLSRLCKKNEIKAVEKGKYYVTGTTAYAVASNITYPSYISMLSAFRYHGITTQNIVRLEVVSAQRHAPIEDIGGYSVRFIKLNAGKIFGFYRDRENGAFVAQIEKAVVDSLYMDNLPLVYVEEAIETAKADGKLDVERLSIFADRMGSIAIKKRLEKIGIV